MLDHWRLRVTGLYRQMEAAGREGTHVLILGCPRSGTSLLASMLACHPDVAMLNEDLGGGSFFLLSKSVRGNKLTVPNEIDLEHSLIRNALSELVYFTRRLLRPISKRIGLPIPALNRRSVVGIRDYELLPNLHILGVIRDPQDVIPSMMQRGSQSGRTAEFRWRRSVEILHQLWLERAAEDSITMIHFDRLVKDPEDVMRLVFSRLQCEFSDVVLGGYRHTSFYPGHTGIENDKAGERGDDLFEHFAFDNNPALRETFKTLLSASV